MALSTKLIAQAYKTAASRYAELGVDTEVALATVAKIPISLNCWQGMMQAALRMRAGHHANILLFLVCSSSILDEGRIDVATFLGLAF